MNEREREHHELEGPALGCVNVSGRQHGVRPRAVTPLIYE